MRQISTALILWIIYTVIFLSICSVMIFSPYNNTNAAICLCSICFISIVFYYCFPRYKKDINISTLLYESKYLRLMEKDGWDYVERTNTNKIAYIVPLKVDKQGNESLLFIKKFRVPLQKYVISFPAGLIGDHDKNESMIVGAQRELVEEVGYTGKLRPITRGPTSAGLSNEIIDFFLATDLQKQITGGKGDGTENIEVFEIPLHKAFAWLDGQSYLRDCLIDSKVYLGLYFVSKWVNILI